MVQSKEPRWVPGSALRMVQETAFYSAEVLELAMVQAEGMQLVLGLGATMAKAQVPRLAMELALMTVSAQAQHSVMV